MITNTNIINLISVEPPFWWSGLKYSKLQLLVYGKNIGKTIPIIKSNGLIISNFQKIQNLNYLFLEIDTTNCIPGIYIINFEINSRIAASYEFEIKHRSHSELAHYGFDSSDVVYLIMPDRFAQGKTIIEDFPEMEPFNLNNPNGRHGGDLQGITNHLDYLVSLGVTTLWLTPFLENNMPDFSYHGYAITNFYKTDPRLGTNADYRNLVNHCHRNGIKVIMDVVVNHCGLNHWFIKDMPTPDWIHQHSEYTKTNNRISTLSDPYSSDYDKDIMVKGWFDTTMPDLNQKNQKLAKYLIQNTLWWIEYSGINGIRIDTLPYSYKDFITEFTKTIIEDYPKLRFVGEVWTLQEITTGYWQNKTKNYDSFNSNLQTVTDFPFCFGLQKSLTEPEGFSEGMNRLYQVLANDFAYHSPIENLIFADNHDLTRIFSILNYNINAWKIAMGILLTMRGIPQIYYGTEILMDGYEYDGHGEIRKDFPGGWKGDKINAFDLEGLTKDQIEAYNYLKILLNWRKQKKVIHSGKLKHFIPEKGLYVYFRYDDNETVMIIVNNTQNKTISTKRYKECLINFSSAKDIITFEEIYDLKEIKVLAKSIRILELKK